MNVRATELVGGRSNHAHLTKKGKRQALLAGQWLLEHNVSPSLVVSSPATRTLETAQQALRGMHSAAPIITDDRLQELSQGIMEGKPRQEVWNEAAVQQLQRAPMMFAHPGGESWYEVQQRMLEWYEETADRHPHDETILVAAHGLATRALVGLLLGWSHAQMMSTETTNCSLTKIIRTDTDDIVEYVGKEIITP